MALFDWEDRFDIETLQFLKKWLAAHILDLDRRYAPYLRKAQAPGVTN